MSRADVAIFVLAVVLGLVGMGSYHASIRAELARENATTAVTVAPAVRVAEVR